MLGVLVRRWERDRELWWRIYEDENIYSLTFFKGMCFIKKDYNKNGEIE